MGNRRLYKIECFDKLGTLESERLKVTALNLFHPPTSLSKESVFSVLRHSLLRRRGACLLVGRGGGKIIYCVCVRVNLFNG
jgi:hypothetical protein